MSEKKMCLVEQVHMIILMAHKFEDTVSFYKDRGFVCAFHLKEKWAEFDLGGVKLGLCPTSDQNHDRRSRLVLEVADVDAVYKAWKAEGVDFVNEPKVAIHGIMATFTDPDGNLVDLYQATPEKVKDLVRKVKEQDCCSDTAKESGCSKNKATGCCKAKDAK